MAFSKSQSMKNESRYSDEVFLALPAKIIFGFFPPNSKDSFLNLLAAEAATFDPVLVPPVNEMPNISSCSTIGFPTVSPYPCTTLNTPSGRPMSEHISASSVAVVGVNSLGFLGKSKQIVHRTNLGFATMVFPIIRAGAIFQVSRYKGKFHGVINPTTPSGFLNV